MKMAVSCGVARHHIIPPPIGKIGNGTERNVISEIIQINVITTFINVPITFINVPITLLNVTTTFCQG